MRVAFVSETTAEHDGANEGADRLDRLARHLTNRGHEVDVLCRQWWEGRPDTFVHDDLTYHGVVGPSEPSYLFPLKLPGAIRAVSPDVVHARSDPPGSVFGAHWARMLSRTPLVVDWYDPPRANGLLRNYAYRYAVRAPARGVSPSEFVRTKVREWGADGDSISVIPTGIEMDTIHEFPPDESGGDIVFSRRLDEDANLETLLLALAEFREYDWRATIIGDGPERAAFERQSRDLRIDRNVEFVGEKSVEERIGLFKNAHVYVHTAERTSFAHDLARALACGCVGIVEYHANSSAHELVETEDRGFLATSSQELTEQLVVAGDHERMSVNESFARYDDGEMVDAYLDIYRTLGAGD